MSSQANSKAPGILDKSHDELMQLDPRSKTLDKIVWSILIGIVGTILLVGCLLVWLFSGKEFQRLEWFGFACVAAVLIVLVWLSRFFPERTYATTSYRLHSHGLEIRRGIWWQHRIFIPANRIQHTDVQQGPIERRFELATLIVNTGGTHEPSISLSGLRIDHAEQLRDKISVKECNPQIEASSPIRNSS